MLSNAYSLAALNKSDRAKVRLLEAGLRIFGQKGPEGATVREIARAAGQNVAAIAYHFGSKQELYHAVIQGILRELHHRLDESTRRMEQLRTKSNPSRREALGLLKDFLGAVYLRLLSQQAAVPIARLIVREQLGPTAGFEILYEQGFRRLHESLCFLVGVVLGRDPRQQDVILRTHMLMGQVYFFAMSREAILRRLGWTSLEGQNAQLVVELLEENIDTLLLGLARKSGKTRTGTRRVRNGSPSDKV